MPHALTKTDVKRAQDAIRNGLFFAAYPEWISAIEEQLKMGVRAEQQALATWGLNFVMDEYLPQKLADSERLPALAEKVRDLRAVRLIG